MSTRTEVELPRWWRALLVASSLAVLCPMFLLDPVGVPPPVGRTALAVLAVAQAGAVWWMGSRPAVVTAVALCAGAGIQALYPEIGPGIALLVVSSFGWMRAARVSLWAPAGAVALSAVAASFTGRWSEALLWSVAALLAWSWGALGRARSARRRAEAERAVLEERARIARELHDVLAHSVSVMVVQATAAGDVFDADPARAKEALRDLESCGRQALTELRRFLRTVRSLDEGDALSDETASGPQPGLADLDELGRSLAAAGLDVVIRREGLGHAVLDPGLELSSYRIVQESLTNTLRHARASRAEVDLSVAGGVLAVEVRDNGTGGGRRTGRDSGHGGTGGGTGGGGLGIIGMRERAAVLGGSVEAGPDPAGGFRVSARLPLEDRS